LVLRPGFGPGSATFFRFAAAIHGPSLWKFDRTILPEHKLAYYLRERYIFVPSPFFPCDVRVLLRSSWDFSYFHDYED
jgi:hypothetical protein